MQRLRQLRGLDLCVPCQVCDAAREFHASRAETGSSRPIELAHTWELGQGNPEDCPPSARVCEATRRFPARSPLSFQTPHAGTQSSCQCDRAMDRQFSFDISAHQQGHKCTACANRHGSPKGGNADKRTHYKSGMLTNSDLESCNFPISPSKKKLTSYKSQLFHLAQVCIHVPVLGSGSTYAIRQV